MANILPLVDNFLLWLFWQRDIFNHSLHIEVTVNIHNLIPPRSSSSDRCRWLRRRLLATGCQDGRDAPWTKIRFGQLWAISDSGGYGQYRGNGVSLINLIPGNLPSLDIKANGNGSSLHREIDKLQINLLFRSLTLT